MPGAFPVRPPIGASETASSYASRLARANGRLVALDVRVYDLVYTRVAA